MKYELTINVDDGATPEEVAKAVADSLERMTRIEMAPQRPASPRPIIEALVRALRRHGASSGVTPSMEACAGLEYGQALALANAEEWLRANP